MNNNNRIATTLYSLGTSFVSGIYVYIPRIKEMMMMTIIIIIIIIIVILTCLKFCYKIYIILANSTVVELSTLLNVVL